MIKILLWDIDGTLLNFEASERDSIRRLFSEYGFGECTDEMLADYSKINRRYWEALERGELTKPEVLIYRFREFFGKYGLNAHVAVDFNAKYQLYLGDTVVFQEGGYETIEKLQGQITQCAVTNGTKEAQKKKLLTSGLGKLLDYVFISDEIGIEKPNKGFFDEAFGKLRQEIGEFSLDDVMIVGDSLTSDIQGGINAGIKTCWYNPNGNANNLGLNVDYEIRNVSDVIDILDKYK